MDKETTDEENEISANYRKAVEATAVYQAGRILAEARHSIRAAIFAPYRLLKLAARFSNLERTQFQTSNLSDQAQKPSELALTNDALALIQENALNVTKLTDSAKTKYGDSTYFYRVIIEVARIASHTDAHVALDLLCLIPTEERNAALGKEMGLLYYRTGELSQATRIFSEAGIESVLTRQETVQVERIFAEHQLIKQGIEIPIAAAPPEPAANDKVMYVCHTSLPHHTNGYAIRTHNVALALQAEGVDIECVSRPGYPWDRKDAANINEAQADTNIEGINYFRYRTTNLSELPFTQYAKEASDTLYAHILNHGITKVMAASNYVNALPALIAARRAGIPFIYDVRGLWEYTAASKKPNWIRSEGFQLFRRMETLVASEADSVVTLSSQLKEKLVSRGVSAEKIHLALNAVSPLDCETEGRNPGPEIRNRLGIPEEATVIGFIGSIERYEGLHHLITALHNLSERGEEIYLILVGDGKYMQTLHEMCCEMDLLNRVKFIGRIPHKEALEYYDAIDICAYPRQPDEVCTLVPPLKPLEAMMHKKAVIVSKLDPIIELVGGSDNVMLVKPGSHEYLESAIEILRNSETLRIRFSENGYLFAQEKRLWRNSAKHYKKAIEHASATKIELASEYA